MKWLDRSVITFLGPLLWVQGKYTRIKTPVLPEACGERAGVQGKGPLLRLLVVGDSAAAGVGVEHIKDALPGRLVEKLSGGYTVSWALLAQSGLNTEQICQLLASVQPVEYDIAVVSAGVNDVKGLRRVEDWLDNMDQVISLLQEKYSVKHIVISPVPPMHGFSALPQPLRWYLGARAKRFNQHLQKLLAAHSSCSLLANDFPLEADFLAEDGFHPSLKTYDRWANEASDVISHYLRQVSAAS
ncbi:MAG: lipase [Gammaproteobacteria bacterium]|nr:MAG: lipase [Gammaproteobacteria bacterium]